MENHSYAEIIGNPAAPFINELVRRGALFTRSYAIPIRASRTTRRCFSGGTQDIADDGCPHRFTRRILPRI
jgi:acid phosphatase